MSKDENKRRREWAARRRELGPQAERRLLNDLPPHVLFEHERAKLHKGVDIELTVGGSYDVMVRYRTHKAAWQFYDAITFRLWKPYKRDDGEYELDMPKELPRRPRDFKGVKGTDELTEVLNGRNDYYLYCLLNPTQDTIVAHYTVDLEVLRAWYQERIDNAEALGKPWPRYKTKRNRNPVDSTFVIIKPGHLPPDAFAGRSGINAPQPTLFG